MMATENKATRTEKFAKKYKGKTIVFNQCGQDGFGKIYGYNENCLIVKCDTKHKNAVRFFNKCINKLAGDKFLIPYKEDKHKFLYVANFDKFHLMKKMV